MKLYYAIGGGLGHFSRAIAFIHSHPELTVDNTVLMVPDREYYTLASSCLQDAAWLRLKIHRVQTGLFLDMNSLRNWLEDSIDTYQPEEIFLDTFPAGICGEWNQLYGENILFHYVGRYLHWAAYSPPVLLRFHTAYQVEDWHPKQLALLRMRSQSVQPVQLSYPAAGLTNAMSEKMGYWQSSSREVWAVVHSEPAEEAEALLSFARDIASLEGKSPLYLFCSKSPAAEATDVVSLSAFPAYALFPQVDRIITACGFNLMQQAAPYRKKHLCMPFPRRFDDQFWRYRQWKTKAELPPA